MTAARAKKVMKQLIAIHTFASWESIEVGKRFVVLACKETKRYKSGKRVYQVIGEVAE